MLRQLGFLFTLVLVVVVGAGSAVAQSQRGKGILDRFDQKRGSWEVGKSLLDMLPDRDRAPGRRSMAAAKAQRIIDDAAVLHSSLARLLQPMPAEDHGHPRYKAAVKWLTEFEAQIDTWKREREQLVAADKQAAVEQKQRSAEYKAEADQHQALLLEVGQASMQLEHAAKNGGAIDPLTVQQRPAEILDRAAKLEAAVLEQGVLDGMAANCKAKYADLPAGWAKQCPEAVSARKIAGDYKERAAAVLAAYEQALAARSCPAGEARDKRVEKAVTAAFKRTFGKEYKAYHVRMDGAVITTPGVGTVTESANVYVCYEKVSEKPTRCGVWPIGFERHRAGRGPWSQWQHSGNNGPSSDLSCGKAKSGR